MIHGPDTGFLVAEASTELRAMLLAAPSAPKIRTPPTLFPPLAKGTSAAD